MKLNWRWIAIIAFWILFASVIGPGLISDDSYELPILGLAIFLAGAFLTYKQWQKGATP